MAVAVVLYSWLATYLQAFTDGIDVAVAIPALAISVIAWLRSGARRARRRVSPAPTWTDGLPWIALLALLSGLEIACYLSSPRRDHPTLSSMADTAMSVHPGRAGLLAVWLAVGIYLALGPSIGRHG
jgi:hypothetical protein